MIPKTIHYCWYGNKPFNDLQLHCLDSWQRYLPDYEIKRWDASNSPLDLEYAQNRYDKGDWTQLSNFVRLCALYSEGGIYLDTDVELVKSFDALLCENCFVGFQQERKGPRWVNNAVIGSIAGHPFLKKCLALTQAGLNKRMHYSRGPVIFTKVLTSQGLNEYGLQAVGDVKVFPTSYFYPYPWWQTFSPECVTDDTYCIHHWQMSWVRREDGLLNLTWWLGRKYRRLLKSFFGI